MRNESEYYTRLHKESLEKAHTRVIQVAEALIQHVSFIRESDVLPEEWKLYQQAQAFIAMRRKPPAGEQQSAETPEARRVS